MVDKVKAQELRLAGMTYKQIATELDCSEAWCKKNFKDTKAPVKGLEEVIALSKSNTGVTNFQMLGLMMTDKERNDSTKEGKEKIENLKANTTKKVKVVGGVVRPSCLPVNNSLQAFNELLEMINDLDCRLYENIEAYRNKFNLDNHTYNSILSAVIMGSQFGTLNRGEAASRNLIESYHSKAVELEKRNNPDFLKVQDYKPFNIPESEVPY